MSAEIQITEFKFGKFEGQEVKRFTLKNPSTNFEVSLISFGASIQSIRLLDKNQQLVNVVLGFDNLGDYLNPEKNSYLGASVGRVTNRVSNAEFKLNDVIYNLEKNNGKHCLHSGPTGFAKKNWTSDIIDNGVKFTYLSADGEGGFPGEVWVEAIYTMHPIENSLIVEYKAITEKPTPINITNHAYFNLAGVDSGVKIYDHQLRLYADSYLDFNPVEVTVTGKINSVANTKYDFREYVKVLDRIAAEGEWPSEGYDNYFMLNEAGEKRNVASVKSASSGVKLDVYSNQNGVQFYTGNHFNKISSAEQPFTIHQGFCLETHNFPDSMNHENFPQCILNVDEEYSNKTIFTFTVEK